MSVQTKMHNISGIERAGSDLLLCDRDGNGVTLHLDDTDRARRMIAAWSDEAEVVMMRYPSAKRHIAALAELNHLIVIDPADIPALRQFIQEHAARAGLRAYAMEAAE